MLYECLCGEASVRAATIQVDSITVIVLFPSCFIWPVGGRGTGCNALPLEIKWPSCDGENVGLWHLARIYTYFFI